MYSTKDKKLKNKLKRMRITLQSTPPHIPEEEEEEPIPSPKQAAFVNSWWGATSTQASRLY